MKILEALKTKAGIRISLINKIMFWDGTNWLVYEYGVFEVLTLLLKTESEDEALDELVRYA